MRKLEKDQKFYLSNNKGIALVCEPHEGVLEAYSEVVIKATYINNFISNVFFF